MTNIQDGCILPTSMLNNSKIENKDNLDRIHRIKGQVEGIEKMMGENKSCLTVVQQIMAAKSALSSLAVEILYRESCDQPSKEDLKKILNNIVKEV